MDVEELNDENVKNIEPNFHLRVCLSIIYYIGTWPPKGKNRPFYIIGTVCSFFFILGIFLSSEVADLIVSWGDVKMLNTATLLLLTNSVHAYKFVMILVRQKRIEALLDMTKSDMFGHDNVRYRNVLSRYTWKGIFHHIVYQGLGTIAVLCWALTPIVDLLDGRARRLPMQGWYPYNETASPAFEITSLHQSTAIIVACIHNVAIDTLFTGLVNVACCQLTLLKWNIATISEDVSSRKPKIKSTKTVFETEVDHPCRMLQRSEDNKREIVNESLEQEEELYDELRQCVKHSEAICQFTRELEDIFGTMVFFQFLVNCFIICLNAFHISQMKVFVPAEVIGMSMYGACITYQIFIFCWHGNELQIHSTDVALAAYSNKWWLKSERFKRALGIIIMRAQDPFILKAGNIMQLSLNTFVGILRMSYSIFTVLQSTTK